MAFLTALLTMFIIALFKQFKYRLKEYESQLTREIELIDTERKRMHLDLHDEMGAGLASIGLLVQQRPSLENQHIDRKLNHQVEILRKKIREIAYNFIPAILETQGLKMAVTELMEDIKYNHPIEVKYKLEFNDSEFLVSKSIHLYRILKEILTNALKHASCTTINCTIVQIDKLLLVKLADNGIGFGDSNQLYMQKGAGMSHIYARAKILHGFITLTTNTGAGTSYEIKIPIESLLK